MSIDSFTLGRIYELSKAGFTQAQIAEKIGCSQSAVSHCLKRYALYGSITHCRGNGRPSIISTAIETAIMQQNRACPTLSLRKHVAKLANEHSVAVSYCTVRNVLNGNAIAAHSPAKKPALTARHIANRFTAAQD
ncbi:hypothetical protein PAPHI01_2667, partial [Pancytospora philotis]